MPKREYIFDLKVILPSGKMTHVQWDGATGLDACQCYANAHPDSAVIAWRWPTFGIFIGPATIVEPGDKLWNKGETNR